MECANPSCHNQAGLFKYCSGKCRKQDSQTLISGAVEEGLRILNGEM